MVTEVIMKRPLFGCEISQKSKSEFFSATDLCRAGNKWRAENSMSPFDMTLWLRQQNVHDFLSALEKKYGVVKISARGRGHHTWVHPYLFIDMALAISPDLKIEVYSWLYDYLIKYRNDSGDSYRRMCGALYDNSANKSLFPRYITTVAEKIQEECVVEDWNSATQEQLRLRDDIHNTIYTLADIVRDNDRCVQYGIDKAKRLRLKPNVK